MRGRARRFSVRCARQEAYCVIDKNGFRFTVQKSNCLQANVYLKKDLFTRFECEGNHQFGINLSLLIDCLSMLGTNSGNQIALQISYAGEGHPILLQMVDGDGCAPFAVCAAFCLKRDLCHALHPTAHAQAHLSSAHPVLPRVFCRFSSQPACHHAPSRHAFSDLLRWHPPPREGRTCRLLLGRRQRYGASPSADTMQLHCVSKVCDTAREKQLQEVALCCGASRRSAASFLLNAGFRI
jgi:hypothetical protein